MGAQTGKVWPKKVANRGQGEDMSPRGSEACPNSPQDCPNRAPIEPQERPMRAPREPQGSPKGAPREPQESPKGAPREPLNSQKGPKRTTKGNKRACKSSPSVASAGVAKRLQLPQPNDDHLPVAFQPTKCQSTATSQIYEISMAASRAGVFQLPQTLQAIGDVSLCTRLVCVWFFEQP